MLISSCNLSSIYLMCCGCLKYSKRLRVGLRRITCSGSVVKWNVQRTAMVVFIITFVILLGLLVWSLVETTSKTCSKPVVPESGSEPARAASYRDLKKAIADSFKCRGNPGMVVVAIKDGKTVLSESYGVTLPGSGVSITPDTRFHIASLTKAFTAALLVDVFANKNYSLGTPLRDILGDDFRFADDERTKYGSAEDILSHRIGLPNKGFMRFNPVFNRSDFLSFPRYWKTNLPFRGTAKYSSVAFTLAAAITEKVGGRTWEDMMKERLLNPLGMGKTGFAFSTNFSDSDVAKPYSMYKGRKGLIDPLFTRVWNSRCGSGCIVSTADDMTKWMKFMLTDGKNNNGDQVLPESEVHTLTKIRTYLRSSRRDLITKPRFPVTSVADEYALAWRNGYYRGNKILSHTGSSPGFASMLMLYPGENMGIFIAMNGDDDYMYYRHALIHYISDYLLGETPWLNDTTLCSFPLPWKTPTVRPIPHYDKGLKPTLPYIQYIGAYKSPVYGELFVNFNQSTFSLQGFYGVGSWQLFPQKETNNFYGKGMWVTDFWDISGWQFMTADDNPQNITRVQVHGFDSSDPPVFDKVFD